MSYISAGTALVFTGASTTFTGPIDVVAVKSNASTSFSIKDGANEIFGSSTAGAGVFTPAVFRSASGLTVEIAGGGTVTLYLRVHR